MKYCITVSLGTSGLSPGDKLIAMKQMLMKSNRLLRWQKTDTWKMWLIVLTVLHNKVDSAACS